MLAGSCIGVGLSSGFYFRTDFVAKGVRLVFGFGDNLSPCIKSALQFFKGVQFVASERD
jgi:hypothetical protein